MSQTKNKLKYINSTNPFLYRNLGEELFIIHKGIIENYEWSEELTKKVDSLDPNNNLVILERLDTLELDNTANKKDIIDIKKDIVNLSDNAINTGWEDISVTKNYEYDSEGKIIKEISSGDLIRTVEYTYNQLDQITEEVIFEKGVEVGRKDYLYDREGNIIRIISNKGDLVNIAVSDYSYKDLEDRIKVLENTDFGDLATILDSEKAKLLIKTVEDLGIKVQALEGLLPENITNLIDLPILIKKVDELEDKVNRQHIRHRFIVASYLQSYGIPKEITSEASVYLEGLLLDLGDDYVITDGAITFNIPLIDDFEVQIKY